MRAAALISERQQQKKVKKVFESKIFNSQFPLVTVDFDPKWIFIHGCDLLPQYNRGQLRESEGEGNGE